MPALRWGLSTMAKRPEARSRWCPGGEVRYAGCTRLRRLAQADSWAPWFPASDSSLRYDVYRSDLAAKSGKQVRDEVPSNFRWRTSESVDNAADQHLTRGIPLNIDRTLRVVAVKLGPPSLPAPSFSLCGVQVELFEFRVPGDSPPEGLALM